MIKSKLFYKWAALFLLLLLIYVLQSTPGLFPKVFGAMPVLIIPAAVTTSMFLSDAEAAAVGLFCGLLWDAGGPYTYLPGFNALILMVCCCAVSLLISFLMRNNFISALILGSGVLLLQALLWWFFYKVIWSPDIQLSLLLYNVLPRVLYSAVFIVPFYFGARFLSEKLDELQ